MTQKEIAKIIHISQSHISNILRGFRSPPPLLIKKLIIANRKGIIPFDEIKPFLEKSSKSTKLAALTMVIDDNNFDISLSLAIDKLIKELEDD